MIDLAAALAAASRRFLGGRDGHAAAIATLVDLLDGSVLASDAEEALRHVETCLACRHEVAEYAPVVLGLRRYGAAVREAAEPTPDLWPAFVAALTSRGAPVTQPRARGIAMSRFRRGRPLGSRSLLGALAAPALVVAALLPTLGLGRSAYDPAPLLSETGFALGSASAAPLRPAERAVDERANYDVLRWAGSGDWSAPESGAGADSVPGLRIPGVPSVGAASGAPLSADADVAGTQRTDASLTFTTVTDSRERGLGR